MTVKEYFKSKYKQDVTDYPHNILLVHDLPPRKRDNGKSRSLFLCPELCHLTGYPPCIRTNHDLMKKVSRKNKLPSQDRCKKAIQCAQRMCEKAKTEASPLVITPEIIKIKGRLVADAPMFLQTKTSRTKKIGINDLQKDWKRNGMFDQKTLGKGEWALFYQKPINQKKADKLASKMINETKQMGNNVLAPPIL
eukprot:UN34033